MAPGCYTELFFTDEAVALAAGHRPCAECRRDAFNRFKDAYLKGNAHLGLKEKSSIGDIDRILHRERVTRSRGKVIFADSLGNLPDGTFFALTGQTYQAFLVWQGVHWEWSFQGYRRTDAMPLGLQVNVLTPKSTVNALRAGFVPLVLF